MKRRVYVIAVTTHFYSFQDKLEFKISQEAYDSLEKAQNFCMQRSESYQIDEYNFCSEPDDNVWYEYLIMPLTLV